MYQKFTSISFSFLFGNWKTDDNKVNFKCIGNYHRFILYSKLVDAIYLNGLNTSRKKSLFEF